MQNNFLIYSHTLLTVPALGTVTGDFLTTSVPFVAENRVSNVSTLGATFNGLIISSVLGGSGGEQILLEQFGMDSGMWMPPYNQSERIQNLLPLSPYERVSFTYRNNTVADIANVQSSFVGYQNYNDITPIEENLPYIYQTKQVVIPAGGSVTVNVQINPDKDFHCRAFTSVFPVNSILCSVRDAGTGYLYMNVPTLMDNFVYDFINENNFRPLGFSPFVIQRRTTLEVTFTNLSRVDVTTALSLWGNHCYYGGK